MIKNVKDLFNFYFIKINLISPADSLQGTMWIPHYRLCKKLLLFYRLTLGLGPSNYNLLKKW